jgi:AcrR family transcriptional regulator
MGITERRERERIEVRRKILAAARDLFARDGYDRVTMRRIADAIEYSATTIYNHFEDKDDLVHALCQEDFSELLAAFDRQAPPADPVDAIRQLGRAYAHFGLTHPNHYRFMFMTAHHAEGEEHQMSPAGEQTYAVLRSVVEAAVATGRLREAPVDTICQVLWSAAHGVIALRVTFGEDFPCVPPAADLVDQAVENSLRGFLKAEA